MGRLRWRSWLARLYAEGNAARRTALLSCMFLAVLALGAWGWVRADQSNETVSFGALDPIYRSLQLFGLAGGEIVPNPPVQLQVARFLAPATTAGALAVLLSTERFAHSFAARTAKQHVVVVGPASEVIPFLPSPTANRSVVHVVDGRHPEVEERVPEAVRVTTDLAGPGWIASSGARSADEIVVATGDDVANLRILNDILGDRPESPGPAGRGRARPTGLEARLYPTAQWPLRVTVVVGNRSIAITAAIQQAVAEPERDVHVVCRWDRLVDAAAADVVAAETEVRPVALVGDGELVGLFTWHLYHHLLGRYTEGDAHVVERLVLADVAGSDRLAARYSDRPGLKVIVGDLPALARATQAIAVVFVGDEGSRAPLRAYEWACRRPMDAVWFLSTGRNVEADDRIEVGNLRAISALGWSSGAVLQDPWTRLVNAWIRRSSGSVLGGDAAVAADESVRAVRRAVRALAADPGHRLEPSTGDEAPPGPLPTELATAVARASGLEASLCLELRALLLEVDIVVRDAGTTSLTDLRGGLVT